MRVITKANLFGYKTSTSSKDLTIGDVVTNNHDLNDKKFYLFLGKDSYSNHINNYIFWVYKNKDLSDNPILEVIPNSNWNVALVGRADDINVSVNFVKEITQNVVFPPNVVVPYV